MTLSETLCVRLRARVRAKKIKLRLHHEVTECYLYDRGGWVNAA